MSCDIVQRFAVFLTRIINKFQRAIDRRIISLKFKEFDFTLVADSIPLTQDSKETLVEDKFNYYLIIFCLPFLTKYYQTTD